MRFSLIYRTWAFQVVHAVGPWGEQIGLSFWVGARGSGVSLGLSFPWAWRVGLHAYFLNPIIYIYIYIYILKTKLNKSFASDCKSYMYKKEPDSKTFN